MRVVGDLVWVRGRRAALTALAVGLVSMTLASCVASPAPVVGAAVAGNGQATLSWAAPAGDSAAVVTGYRVTPYIGSTAQPPITFTSTATTQTITGLTNGSTYTFTVTAIGPDGDSATSAQSNAVTPSGPALDPVPLAGGSTHTCALKADGTVRCWGDNSWGKLGNTGSGSSTPVTVSGLTNAVAIAVDGNHSCALIDDGTARCWGYNGSGQLGNGTGAPNTGSSTPVTVTGITDAVAITAGADHSCALLNDGTARCWGSGFAGKLGNGTGANSSTPVAVSGLTNATAITAGRGHTCALRGDGTARCWGNNAFGQLGNGTTANSSTPVAVSGLADATSIIAGRSHTCAVVGDDTARCWGSDEFGQLGAGPGVGTTSSIPVPVSGLGNVTAIAGGEYHTCALLDDGGASCWGHNSYGQLGSGTFTHASIPVAVAGGPTNATAITAGDNHTCARIDDGAAQCWGLNGAGQLGIGTTIRYSTPVTVSGLSNTTAITGNSNHSCAVLADGTARCWGGNNLRELGNGTTTPSPTPVAVSGLTNAVAITTGLAHSCALINDGTARCWGRNGSGRLGNGTTTASSIPVTVSGLTDAVAIAAAGDGFTCALIADGTARCWGSNASGELGNGTTTSSSIPVTVSGLADAVAITAGYSYACALIVDGTARCWGSNGSGQLGNGTTTGSLVPVTVSGVADAVAITAFGHTCALIVDGTARCWGSNIFGQLGDGTTTGSSTPVTVSGLTNATGITAGRQHSCAVIDDRTARCWGSSADGQLGNGTSGTATSSTPVTVSGLANAVAITAAGSHTVAVIGDGTARGWGYNWDGQVGNGTGNANPFPAAVIGL